MNSKKPFTPPRRQLPRQYLLNLLKRRLYTEVELREKLRRRRAEPEEIEAVIGELKAHDLVNDARFALFFVQEKLSLNPMGRQRLYFELIKRGIAKELAKETLEGVGEEELVEALRERITERAKRLSGEKSDKQEKLLRFLASRGVSYGQAKGLIEEVLTEEHVY